MAQSNFQKQCQSCQLVKDSSKFYKSKYTEDKRMMVCIACKRKKRAQSSDAQKLSKQARNLMTRYKLNTELYYQMMEEQQRKCWICGSQDEKNFCVDHNHTSGKVRGILCKRCNMGLGGFQDSKALLLKAIEFLDLYDA